MRRSPSQHSVSRGRFWNGALVLTGCLAMLLGTHVPAGAVPVGPNSPGTVVDDASFGTATWTTPTNAMASDNSYAQAAPGGASSHYLKATNFGFSIPAGATIDGITVAIERRSVGGTIKDSSLRIVKGGVVSGIDQASATLWPTSDATATYGGPADLWNETWTPSDINGAGFGVVLSVTDSLDTAAVDHVTITVDYSLCGNGVPEPGEQCDDGNTVGGDCCSATCQYESPGDPCATDGNACTSDECDGSGACIHPNICTDQPIAGLKLILKNAAAGEKAVFVSKDVGFAFPTPTGSDDPRFVGATVDLFSANEGTASFGLPAGTNWTLNGAATVYKFVNKLAPAGPSAVKVAVIKQGKVLKVVSKDTGVPLTGTQGSVGIRVQTGLVRNCAFFGLSTIIKDEPNKFIAKNSLASAISDCADSTLLGSPSGAFLDRPGGL